MAQKDINKNNKDKIYNEIEQKKKTLECIVKKNSLKARKEDYIRIPMILILVDRLEPLSQNLFSEVDRSFQATPTWTGALAIVNVYT